MLDRIVLYIDDLDRCKSDRVVAVLEAVHLLLAFPIFAVVVAVDPRWLRQSLTEHYPAQLSDGRKVDEQFLDETWQRPASPQDYLEKIFQVPFQLQRVEEKSFAALVTQLLSVAAAPNPLSSPVLATEVIPQMPSADQELFPATDQPVIQTEPKTKVSPDVATSTPTRAPEEVQVAPERLLLEEWEQAAIKRCYPLFRTPRAVKRLVNTLLPDPSRRRKTGMGGISRLREN